MKNAKIQLSAKRKEKTMKSLLKLKSILLIVLASGALVFAGGGLECDSCGEPPRGIGIDGNATGTKLTGAITIEFYNIVTTGPNAGNADARLVLRLRKGKTVAVFFGVTPVTDFTNPLAVQTAIINTMTPAVLDEFFNGANLTIKVKSMEEFGELDTLGPTDLTLRSIFVLSNVELAVQ
jgi:hypothetical protein